MTEFDYKSLINYRNDQPGGSSSVSHSGGEESTEADDPFKGRLSPNDPKYKEWQLQTIEEFRNAGKSRGEVDPAASIIEQFRQANTPRKP